LQVERAERRETGPEDPVVTSHELAQPVDQQVDELLAKLPADDWKPAGGTSGREVVEDLEAMLASTPAAQRVVAAQRSFSPRITVAMSLPSSSSHSRHSWSFLSKTSMPCALE